jgi:leucyl aminopeptidase
MPEGDPVKIQIRRQSFEEIQPEAVVVFRRDGKPVNLAASRIPADVKKQMEKSTGEEKLGTATAIPTGSGASRMLWILCGLDRSSLGMPGSLFPAASAAGRAASKAGVRTLCIPFNNHLAPAEAAVRNLTAGLEQGTYQFQKFQGEKRAGNAAGLKEVILSDAENERALKKALKVAEAVAAAIRSTRDLANLPANEATPSFFAKTAQKLARDRGLECRVLGPAELKKENCRLILAVGQGSAHTPRLIILKYPGRKKQLKPIVVIGKTLTFDAGGLSLKPPKGMGWMKYDKSGGMTTLAIMDAIARLRPDRPVIGVLGAAENMPGGDAIRPGDIVRSRSGKSVEINNTDAEGRLVLADALDMAGEWNPEAIVNLATLTGAVIVALGHACTGLMSNRDDLARTLIALGARTGDRFWQLPLWEEYDADLKSPFADLSNIGQNGAGTITAGAFLKQFVKADIPWAHLDIAGTAWKEKEDATAAAGATLAGTRPLVEWILELS